MQAVFQMVDSLTEAEVQQPAEYIEQHRRSSSPARKQRILGLYEGLGGWISDDFTDELPDEFRGFDKGF